MLTQSWAKAIGTFDHTREVLPFPESTDIDNLEISNADADASLDQIQILDLNSKLSVVDWNFVCLPCNNGVTGLHTLTNVLGNLPRLLNRFDEGNPHGAFLDAN